MYPVFICMPSGVTVRDSGLCCCVPCLLSAINSLCLMIFHLSVNDGNNNTSNTPQINKPEVVVICHFLHVFGQNTGID